MYLTLVSSLETSVRMEIIVTELFTVALHLGHRLAVLYTSTVHRKQSVTVII